jgi:hypothetical protein
MRQQIDIDWMPPGAIYSSKVSLIASFVVSFVGHEFRYTVVLFVKLISFFDILDNNPRQLDSYSLTHSNFQWKQCRHVLYE